MRNRYLLLLLLSTSYSAAFSESAVSAECCIEELPRLSEAIAAYPQEQEHHSSLESVEIAQLEKEIERLHARGEHGEAAALERELQRRLDAMGGHPHQQEIRHLEQEIARLRREGKHDEAAAVEMELQRFLAETGEHPLEGGPPDQQETAHLKNEIARLRREGKHVEAETLERELNEMLSRKSLQAERLAIPAVKHPDFALPEEAPVDPRLIGSTRLMVRGNPLFLWEATGGPLGGLGYDIRIRPDNPDITYVTDAWAGVYRSTNGGKHWVSSNGSSPGTRIPAIGGPSGDAIKAFSLTIDPHNYNRIWVGTQTVRGIFLSEDAGKNWQRRDTGVEFTDGISFRGFTVDPLNSEVVYAAAEISSWAWTKKAKSGKSLDLVKGAVYKTTNRGLNWERIWYGDNLARYVIVHPTNTDVIYVSTGIFDREAANSLKSTGRPGGVGILMSNNGGESWQTINHGLENLYVGSLVMHPNDPQILLAGTGSNPYPQGAGVYLSEDGGQSWQYTLPNDIITSVEFSTKQTNVAYAGSAAAIYRSEDRGRSWKRQTRSNLMWGPPGIRAGWPIDFQADPRNAKRLLANAYGGGAFLSNDAGRSWIDSSSGYTGAEMRRVVVDPKNSRRVFASGRSGMFVSLDGGINWKGLLSVPAIQLDWNALALDPDNSQHVVAGNSWNSKYLFESTDGGNSWQQRHMPMPAANKIGWRVIEFAPSKPAQIYAGTGAFKTASQWVDTLPANGFYVSHDGGKTWSHANDKGTHNAQVADLVIDPQFPGLVYAASTTHGILKTTDGGKNWKAMNMGLPPLSQARPLSIAINPQARGTLYCGLKGAGVYRSTDAGISWQPLRKGLEQDAQITDIVLNPVNPDILYAADRLSGVYHFATGQGHWGRINHGLDTRSMNALAFSRDGSTMYAGSEGNGVYRMKLPPLGK